MSDSQTEEALCPEQLYFYLKEAITHFKAALEVVKTSSIYLSHGNSLLVTSDFRTALTTYQAALELFKNSKDKKGEGNALGGLGLAYYSLGQYDKAIEHHKQALAISREIGDRRGEGNSLGNLGIAYDSFGQYDRDAHKGILAGGGGGQGRWPEYVVFG